MTAQQIEARVREKIAEERGRAVEELARAVPALERADAEYGLAEAAEQQAWERHDAEPAAWASAHEALVGAATRRFAAHDRLAFLRGLLARLDDPEEFEDRYRRRLDAEQRFQSIRDRAGDARDGAPPDRPQRAAGNGKGEQVPTTKDKPRGKPGPKEAQARAQREAKAERKAPNNGEAPEAPDVLKALVAAVREKKVGTVKAHGKGLYARVMDGKRTVGYLVPRKGGVRIYVAALAGAMPDGVSFTRVELGSHHYGRGEVIVDVSGEDDFGDAVAALEAAAANPVPRKGKEAS